MDGTQRILLFTKDIGIATEAHSASRLDKVSMGYANSIPINHLCFYFEYSRNQMKILFQLKKKKETLSKTYSIEDVCEDECKSEVLIFKNNFSCLMLNFTLKLMERLAYGRSR